MGGLSRRLGFWTWTPAILDPKDVIHLKVLLALVALSDAVDYLLGEPQGGVVAALENSVPIEVWGGLCLVSAVCLLIGMTFRHHRLVWVGHAVAAVVYTSLAVSLAWAAMSTVPPGGWRSSGRLAVAAWVHFTLAMRSTPSPMSDDEEVSVVETVVAPKE